MAGFLRGSLSALAVLGAAFLLAPRLAFSQPEVCGDGVCVSDCITCPADCGTCCGDGACDDAAPLHENNGSCPADCFCGDGMCHLGDEFNKGCVADCCDSNQSCDGGEQGCSGDCGCDSDGTCEPARGETSGNCSSDCGCDSDGTCEASRGEDSGNCSADCGCDSDGTCEAARGETAGTCSADCGCDSDGTCEASRGEDSGTCSADCGCDSDGLCEAARGETLGSCAADCTPGGGDGGGESGGGSEEAEEPDVEAALGSNTGGGVAPPVGNPDEGRARNAVGPPRQGLFPNNPPGVRPDQRPNVGGPRLFFNPGVEMIDKKLPICSMVLGKQQFQAGGAGIGQAWNVDFQKSAFDPDAWALFEELQKKPGEKQLTKAQEEMLARLKDQVETCSHGCKYDKKAKKWEDKDACLARRRKEEAEKKRQRQEEIEKRKKRDGETQEAYRKRRKLDLELDTQARVAAYAAQKAEEAQRKLMELLNAHLRGLRRVRAEDVLELFAKLQDRRAERDRERDALRKIEEVRHFQDFGPPLPGETRKQYEARAAAKASEWKKQAALMKADDAALRAADEAFDWSILLDFGLVKFSDVPKVLQPKKPAGEPAKEAQPGKKPAELEDEEPGKGGAREVVKPTKEGDEAVESYLASLDEKPVPKKYLSDEEIRARGLPPGRYEAATMRGQDGYYLVDRPGSRFFVFEDGSGFIKYEPGAHVEGRFERLPDGGRKTTETRRAMNPDGTFSVRVYHSIVDKAGRKVREWSEEETADTGTALRRPKEAVLDRFESDGIDPDTGAPEKVRWDRERSVYTRSAEFEEGLYREAFVGEFERGPDGRPRPKEGVPQYKLKLDDKGATVAVEIPVYVTEKGRWIPQTSRMDLLVKAGFLNAVDAEAFWTKLDELGRDGKLTGKPRITSGPDGLPRLEFETEGGKGWTGYSRAHQGVVTYQEDGSSGSKLVIEGKDHRTIMKDKEVRRYNQEKGEWETVQHATVEYQKRDPKTGEWLDAGRSEAEDETAGEATLAMVVGSPLGKAVGYVGKAGKAFFGNVYAGAQGYGYVLFGSEESELEHIVTLYQANAWTEGMGRQVVGALKEALGEERYLVLARHWARKGLDEMLSGPGTAEQKAYLREQMLSDEPPEDVIAYLVIHGDAGVGLFGAAKELLEESGKTHRQGRTGTAFAMVLASVLTSAGEVVAESMFLPTALKPLSRAGKAYAAFQGAMIVQQGAELTYLTNEFLKADTDAERLRIAKELAAEVIIDRAVDAHRPRHGAPRPEPDTYRDAGGDGPAAMAAAMGRPAPSTLPDPKTLENKVRLMQVYGQKLVKDTPELSHLSDAIARGEMVVNWRDMTVEFPKAKPDPVKVPIRFESTPGELGDRSMAHYDPGPREIVLSLDYAGTDSTRLVAVLWHEIGHAYDHNVERVQRLNTLQEEGRSWEITLHTYLASMNALLERNLQGNLRKAGVEAGLEDITNLQLDEQMIALAEASRRPDGLRAYLKDLYGDRSADLSALIVRTEAQIRAVEQTLAAVNQDLELYGKGSFKDSPAVQAAFSQAARLYSSQRSQLRYLRDDLVGLKADLELTPPLGRPSAVRVPAPTAAGAAAPSAPAPILRAESLAELAQKARRRADAPDMNREFAEALERGESREGTYYRVVSDVELRSLREGKMPPGDLFKLAGPREIVEGQYGGEGEFLVELQGSAVPYASGATEGEMMVYRVGKVKVVRELKKQEVPELRAPTESMEELIRQASEGSPP